MAFRKRLEREEKEKEELRKANSALQEELQNLRAKFEEISSQKSEEVHREYLRRYRWLILSAFRGRGQSDLCAAAVAVHRRTRDPLPQVEPQSSRKAVRGKFQGFAGQAGRREEGEREAEEDVGGGMWRSGSPFVPSVPSPLLVPCALSPYVPRGHCAY
jgi:hypothetical protein